MNNSEKIKITNELLNTVKDYLELLKVSPKLKQTFNTEVINEQLNINEKEMVVYVNKLRN